MINKVVANKATVAAVAIVSSIFIGALLQCFRVNGRVRDLFGSDGLSHGRLRMGTPRFAQPSFGKSGRHIVKRDIAGG